MLQLQGERFVFCGNAAKVRFELVRCSFSLSPQFVSFLKMRRIVLHRELPAPHASSTLELTSPHFEKRRKTLNSYLRLSFSARQDLRRPARPVW